MKEYALLQQFNNHVHAILHYASSAATEYALSMKTRKAATKTAIQYAAI
jgi:hypothetical protein